jgi:peptidoglycan/LPS O-acetylase OafA/YrhL
MVLQQPAAPTAMHERMTVAEQQAPSVRDAAYIGGLDGLRAVAVAAVIVYHFAPSALPAGFLGVDVFFVVSGFLIARLLVSEVARNGRVSPTNFWGRRARRLLPALATMTVVVCIVAANDFTELELHDVRSHALGTLFYCANWVMNAGHQNYFASVGRPSPFLHMWSLAVEEQFYIVLPLVFCCIRGTLVRRPVRVAIVALLGAVASALWMSALVAPGDDPSRAYLGSDSHAMGLLVGVALGVLAGAGAPWEAIAARVHRHETAVRWSFGLGVAAFVGIACTMWFANDQTYGLYRGGFLAFSLACGVLIASVVLTPTTPLARVLSAPWLVAIGLRSYSLYLWHWPVRVFIGSDRLDGFGLFVVRLAASIVLAEVSFRLVERPFRSGAIARRSGSRGAVAYFAALVVVTSVLVATIAAPTPRPALSTLQNVGSEANARHIETFGDSTALVFGYNGALHGKELGIAVGGDADLGCAIVPAEHFNGSVVFHDPGKCNGWQERWPRKLRADPGAVVVLMAGAWDVLDHRVDGTRVRFGTPEWTQLVTSSYRSALRVLGEGGRTVYVFEVPCFGTGDRAEPMPDRGDPQRIAAVNAIYESLAREMPRVKIVRWRALVCPGGRRAEEIDGVQMWEPDEVHLTEAGAVVVWKWFLPQVR